MITLKYIKNSEEKATPVIASFQQNVPDSELLKQLDFTLYDNKESRKKQKVLMSENEKFQFFSKSMDRQQNSKYLLGVIQSSSGKSDPNEMKVYEMDHIFCLKQSTKVAPLPSSSSQSQNQQQQQQQQQNSSSTNNNNNAQSSNYQQQLGNIAKTNTTIWEQKQILVEAMGTSKAKRKVQQMMNNRVEEKSISSVSNMNFLLKQKSDDLKDKITAEEEELKQQEISAKRELLPEFNLEAQNASEIYDINSIISQEEWENLAVEPYIVALKKQKISQETQNMSPFVQDLFNNFDQLFGDRPMQKTPIIKYLMYLDFLIRSSYKPKFLKNSIEEVAKELRFDVLFAKNIMLKFYQITPSNDNKISYSRSGALRDKLYCYIITLILFAFNFKLDAAPLAKHLKIEPKRFIQLAKEIGCSTIIKENKQEDNSLISQQINIELKAPLKLQFLANTLGKGKFKK